MIKANRKVLCTALVLMLAAGLSACGSKEKKAGQALASVNGEEITVLQLNEELQRAGVQAAQQEEASKQLLEALIDRQLLQNEAQKEKIDRDPKVQQAIERAKALIVAQAYMQKRVGNIARPTKEEVEAYFKQHPEFFANRKAFDLRQLVIASEDMNDALKAAMDQAKSLEEVVVWMESHKVKYARAQVVRSSADLPPELSGKLLAMPKGQLFIIREGARTMLMAIADIKEAPVTLEVAQQQIEQFLFNKKNKEAADAEVKRLRASAKVEYLGKQKAPAAPAASATAAAPAPGAPAPGAPLAAPAAAEGAPAADPLGGSAERGVAGLK
ncbi:EpsD family peptidyl-prolyl cis-trans isomerase [Massilia sp. erpn]|uniref:EpsD family peptidyl-prolyl cis-trans isomerase n=1 Tax=Massilia sp. erpn TaxID=2738142 RepID=UPI0021039F28|nr:EpsD family peptidyl-prolyl cis-trans isomerase [Massilia sp. erpn]UTY55794.1 peptidyl-prolyl cis-trans isomerase, EpsD family [Massilia sp. erpn]